MSTKPETVAAVLQSIQTKRDLSLRAMEELTGVSIAYLSLMLRGERVPSPKTARKLVQGLGSDAEPILDMLPAVTKGPRSKSATEYRKKQVAASMGLSLQSTILASYVLPIVDALLEDEPSMDKVAELYVELLGWHRNKITTAKYDADADVLYVSVGRPCAAVCEEVEPGLLLRMSHREDKRALVGVTVVGLLERWPELKDLVEA